MPNLRHRSTPKDLPGSWKSPAFIVLCLVTAQVTACAHSPSVKSEGEELSASAAAAPSEVARHKASTSPTATHERHAGEHHHGVEAGEIEHGYDALRRKYTHHDHPEHNDDLEGDDHSLHVPTVSCKLHDYEDESPPALEGGAWEGVFPAEGSSAVHNILGMQTVHVVMLPSGKLLLISGSSWRNRNGIQYFPKYEDPETPAGLFIREEDPFRNEKLDEYYELVNNAAIYDPVDNTFYRVNVPNPEPDPHVPDHFAPNDFFCTGHQHLPNGNVLFTGGTQYYSPYRTGNNTSYIFNWRTELEMDWKHIDWRRRPVSNDGSPWIFSGFMKRGRWYPSLVPLLDGRLAIFSGYVGFDEGFPPMYTFEINSWIEVFDPDKFDPGNLDLAWKAVDAAGAPDGPFTHEINPDFKPTPGVACPERCLESNKYDAFKLYPQNYLQPDGRIYLTREGDWVSLRTCDAAFMRKTKATYFMSLEEQNGDLKLDFDRGPDRPQDVTSYGTTFRDLKTGEIFLLGGQPNSPGTLYPLNADRTTDDPKEIKTTHFAGGLGSAQLETFVPDHSTAGGSWTLDPTFLGDQPQDVRTMHYTVALPTGQILVINGGNYDFYGPTFHPILLTPEHDPETGHRTGFSKQYMLDALEPRLYHNAAVLLPDGRVFVSGGNSARATVTPSTGPIEPWEGEGQPPPNLDNVELDVYFFDDGPMGKGLPGQLTTPTENWTAEIYSPPYLFIDGKRRAKIDSLEPLEEVSYTPHTQIGGKRYDLFHSGVSYHMALSDLPSCAPENAKLMLIKLPSVTHGWQTGQEYYQLDFEPAVDGVRFTTPDARASLLPPAFYMLFYTDCRGKPSEAWMVRFDDRATAP